MLSDTGIIDPTRAAVKIQFRVRITLFSKVSIEQLQIQIQSSYFAKNF